MGGLGSPVLAGVHLDHLGDVERINTSKRVGGDKDDATVGIDFLLGVSELDGL